MFDIKRYYAKEIEKSRESYHASINTIKKIQKELDLLLKDKNDSKQVIWEILAGIAKTIIQMSELEKELSEDYFKKHSFDDLKKENTSYYLELLPDNYQTSFVNPTYAVKKLGEPFGQLFSFFCSIYKYYLNHALFHKIFKMEKHNQVFISVYNYLIKEELNYQKLKDIIILLYIKRTVEDDVMNIKELNDPEFRYYQDIIENEDLNDLRYLFKSSRYISDHVIETAKFLINYPEEKLRILAQLIADAYIRGFEIDRKDISKKSTVSVQYSLGQEKLVKLLIQELSNRNLECILRPSPSSYNKQYTYDHRFTGALFIDEEFVKEDEKIIKASMRQTQNLLMQHSGIIGFDVFGEKPFKPENKKECLKFSDVQQKLVKVIQNNFIHTREKYHPRVETSFTVIAFPSPEIGPNFKEIFSEILEVNMLDPIKYQKIQQIMIDVLDQADFVHVKGKGKNKTNIKVKMQEIQDPSSQTIFENCGADINIPVGEVFTTPHLRGTNGILHVEESYLRDIKYDNIVFTFKDGYIDDYTCSNFKSEIDNKKMIEENLFFPNKTLPLGEFAIGTNTLAYVIANKYNILSQLPILIVEKMGPHFAIGDTCFSRQEDFKVFNPFNGKEMIARENEKTILRKEDINKAYTYCHTDITLPYQSIDFIAAITKSGDKIDIIKNGKFVLKGTEELNEPFGT